MSIGVLATSDQANNATAARGAKKAVHDGEAPSSGFKDLVRGQKNDNKMDRDAASNAAESEENIPRWRRFGLHLEPGATKKDLVEDDADDETLLVQDGLDTDAEAVATTVVAIVEINPQDTGAGQPAGANDDAAMVGDAAAASGVVTAQLTTTPAAVVQEPEVPHGTASAQGEIANGAQNIAQAAILRSENAHGKTAARSEIVSSAQTAAQLQLQTEPETTGNGTENGRQNQKHANQDGAEIQKLAQVAGSSPVANVSVISSQIAPAPVQAMPMSETSAAFATSLATEVLPNDRADATAQTTLTQNFGKAAPITTLKIQLHPAELGVVTARLSGTEAQLSIAITVDNAEARHRLTTDADAIISALKGMGIDVDRVTIQQQQPGSGASAHGDGRGGEFRQSGESRGDSQGQSSRQESGSDNGENLHRPSAVDKADAAAGSGVYI